MKICAINNCKDKTVARGYCNKHYLRFMKYGDANYLLEHRTCEVKGCAQQAGLKTWDGPYSKYCTKHRQRWAKYGDPGITKFSREREAHGMTYRAEYHAYNHMKNRCYSPKNKHYKDYGGRGIKVCDEWLNSFKAFYEHIGDKPSPKHSLDRIDNDGNYAPNNVRWATTTQQATNQRPKANNTSGFPGVYFHKQTNRWVGSVQRSNKKYQTKEYASLSDAVEARASLLASLEAARPRHS